MCTYDDNRFFVYLHRRATDNKVFYVGKGTGRRNLSVSGRNNHWHNVKKKHGIIQEIIFDDLSHQEALDLEADAILEMSYFGEPLTNKNAGGTGFAGMRTPEHVKEKIAKGVRETFTHEKRAAYSSMIKGRKMTDSARLKLSMARRDHNKYRWENLSTGEVFEKTKAEMRIEHAMKQQDASDLASGRAAHRGGWKIEGTQLPHDRDVRSLVDVSSGKVFMASRLDLQRYFGVESSEASRLFSGKKRMAKNIILMSRADEIMTISEMLLAGLLRKETLPNGDLALIRCSAAGLALE